MLLTFLGTGTSHGIPVIGCSCPVCRSQDPRNQRNRCGVYVQWEGVNLLIDTPPELRIQALRYGVEKVDGVLFTHTHADHLAGFDDLRRFNQLTGSPLPIYSSASVIEGIQETYPYAFGREVVQFGGGLPEIEGHVVEEAWEESGVRITPIPVFHGLLPILGWRLGNLAYLTDCKTIPAESQGLLAGVEVLVLGAVRYRPHPTHFNVQEACAFAQSVGAKRTYLTHICHDIEHTTLQAELPQGVYVAYDGLKVEI